MPSTLPDRLYRAMTVRVVHLNCVLVDIDLRFGVRLRKNLLIEGIDCAAVSPGLRSDATHCLVKLVGGRDLLVQTDDEATDGFLKSRVFLCDTMARPPDGTLAVPPGMAELRVDLALMWAWVAAQSYNPRAVAWCFGRDAKMES